MSVYRLLILAVALATAAAWPRPGEDALDDWFSPFFNCELLNRRDIQEKQTELHTKLHEAKRDGWPSLTTEEKRLVIDTANKIKPVLVEAITSTCSLVSGINETEKRSLERVSNNLKDRVLEREFRADLANKITIGDLSSIDKLAEKIIQELRVVLRSPRANVTESERNDYINYFTQEMDIIRHFVNGVTPIINALTLQEVVDLKIAMEKLVVNISFVDIKEFFTSASV